MQKDTNKQKYFELGEKLFSLLLMSYEEFMQLLDTHFDINSIQTNYDPYGSRHILSIKCNNGYIAALAISPQAAEAITTFMNYLQDMNSIPTTEDK